MSRRRGRPIDLVSDHAVLRPPVCAVDPADRNRFETTDAAWDDRIAGDVFDTTGLNVKITLPENNTVRKKSKNHSKKNVSKNIEPRFFSLSADLGRTEKLLRTNEL